MSKLVCIYCDKTIGDENFSGTLDVRYQIPGQGIETAILCASCSSRSDQWMAAMMAAGFTAVSVADYDRMTESGVAGQPRVINDWPRPTKKQPSMATLEKMATGAASPRATDGCRDVDPDGCCRHGYPSWLIELGIM